jgi:hypothetical protein
LSFYARHLNSARGVVSVADVVSFASYVVLGLFLAQRSIDALRYKRS